MGRKWEASNTRCAGKQVAAVSSSVHSDIWKTDGTWLRDIPPEGCGGSAQPLLGGSSQKHRLLPLWTSLCKDKQGPSARDIHRQRVECAQRSGLEEEQQGLQDLVALGHL